MKITYKRIVTTFFFSKYCSHNVALTSSDDDIVHIACTRAFDRINSCYFSNNLFIRKTLEAISCFRIFLV